MRHSRLTVSSLIIRLGNVKIERYIAPSASRNTCALCFVYVAAAGMD